MDSTTTEAAADAVATLDTTVDVSAVEAPQETTESVAETAVEPAPAEAPAGEETRPEQEMPAAPKPPKGAHPLVGQVMAAPHRVYLLGKVRKAIAAAGEGEQGPWLREAEAYILEQVQERAAAKERLCARAEELQESTAWRVTGDAYRALFEEWKQVGAAGRELDDQLWARFNAARGTFNERRTKHFEERQQEWTANRERKEALCTLAEAFADSTEWKRTAEAIRDLQAKWKATGSAGRDYDDALWGRFNAAKQVFFDRRTAAWEESRARKEAICLEAEALKDSTDWRRAADAIKAMQADWKTIGPAGREHEDRLWQRFRAATQVFFDRRSETFAERTREERENLATKLDLCARAEALDLHVRTARRRPRGQGSSGPLEGDRSGPARPIRCHLGALPRRLRPHLRERGVGARPPAERVANADARGDAAQARATDRAARVDHPRRGQPGALAGHALQPPTGRQIRGDRRRPRRQDHGRDHPHPRQERAGRGTPHLDLRHGGQTAGLARRRWTLLHERGEGFFTTFRMTR